MKRFNPFVPTVAFSQLSSNICCPRDCVSRHNGGTRGAPIIPRDAVFRTANVERNGGHKWVKLCCASDRCNFSSLAEQKQFRTVNNSSFKLVIYILVNWRFSKENIFSEIPEAILVQIILEKRQFRCQGKGQFQCKVWLSPKTSI